MKRRTLLLGALSASAGLLIGQVTIAQETKPKLHLKKVKPHNIKIRASKFEFSPNHITIKQGERVTFELTATDFTHGFSIPDMTTRTDIPPGQVRLLSVTPELAGDFIFLCDNFCGDGHEKMQGKITVVAA